MEQNFVVTDAQLGLRIAFSRGYRGKEHEKDIIIWP